MAQSIRSHDWARTQLGPTGQWPQSLRTVVDVILDAPMAMIVLWGPHLVQIYNDSYREIMAGKHPRGLGQPTRDCWPEVWHFNQPIYEAVFRGESRTFTNQKLTLERHGRPEDAWFDLTFSPLRDDDARIAGVLVTVFETTARVIATRELKVSDARLRLVGDLVPDLLWRFDAAGRAEWFNHRWLDYTGLSEEDARGDGWQHAIHPEDLPASRRTLAAALETGRPLELQHRMRRRDGVYRWFLVRAEVSRDEDGTGAHWLGVATDIHDLRRLQEQTDVLVSELQHRTRNLLTLVQSIAQQTITSTTTSRDFMRRFNDRLGALARVQDLLSHTGDAPINIADLVHMELDALASTDGGDRITMDGPSVPLRKRAVQTLALALHELATNARKYGALAVDDGRLCVLWRLTGDTGDARHLCLEWIERVPGGAVPPPSATPSRQGYGRQLIERALPGALGAEVTFDLKADGLTCTIHLPLSDCDGTVLAG